MLDVLATCQNSKFNPKMIKFMWFHHKLIQFGDRANLGSEMENQKMCYKKSLHTKYCS